MRLLNDIRAYSLLDKEKRYRLAAFLTVTAAVLSVADSLIPKPLPMLKIGLANIVTLVLVIEGRYSLALKVALLRSVISGFMTGTLFSFSGLLSLTGGIVSCAGMALIHMMPGNFFSIMGISVAGAFLHTVAQGAVVAVMLTPDRGTLFLVSLMGLFSLAGGFLTGYLGTRFYKEVSLQNHENDHEHKQNGDHSDHDK